MISESLAIGRGPTGRWYILPNPINRYQFCDDHIVERSGSNGCLDKAIEADAKGIKATLDAISAGKISATVLQINKLKGRQSCGHRLQAHQTGRLLLRRRGWVRDTLLGGPWPTAQPQGHPGPR